MVEGDTILHVEYRWLTPFGQPLDAIRMAINLSNYAIVEFKRGIFGEYVHLKFQRQPDGRYYPVYIKRVSPVIGDKAKYKPFHHIEVFEADRIETRTRRKLNPADLEDGTIAFDAGRFVYDTSFWESYMKRNLHPIDSAILESLEERATLQEQFSHKKK